MKKELIRESFMELYERTKAPDPSLGGGGVCALQGIYGIGLSLKAVNLSRGKKKYEELPEDVRVEVENIATRLQEIVVELSPLAEEDGRSFDGALEAMRLPKETPQQEEVRRQAIEKGYRYAISIPFQIAALCMEALKKTDHIAMYATATAITDVAISSLMLESAVKGVLYNVTINLSGVSDDVFRNAAKEERDDLIAEAVRVGKEIRKIIENRLPEK